MAKGFVTMSATEIDRAEVVRKVLEKRITQAKACELLGLSVRHVKRLCRGFKADGVAALVSRKRGRVSRKISDNVRDQAVGLVRELYSDFGPKLAQEKLLERHGLRVGRETLRKWLADAGVWLTRVARLPRAHQPRNRRQCLGELIQIDGCQHRWFEDRGPTCALLVYVDDATGRLMELRFAVTESAFDYFEATVSYIHRHGRPVAFYSAKYSIFRVHHEGATGRAAGISQFGRALADLNIDIICANSPQAKGRVERMNKTLQDRLVKEMRLQGISTMEAANAFAPAFIADYNQRFGRAPLSPEDAHRPLLPDQDLTRIFTWQEQRTLTRNLVVHFKRRAYLVVPTPHALDLGRRRVSVAVHEAADGEVVIRHAGVTLPYDLLDKQPQVAAADVVENKRLGAVLSMIQDQQTVRDEKRLSAKKLTIREKRRLQVARGKAGRPPIDMSRRVPVPPVPPPPVPASARGDRVTVMKAFMERFAADQAERQLHYNQSGNQRKRHLELEDTIAQRRRLP